MATNDPETTTEMAPSATPSSEREPTPLAGEGAGASANAAPGATPAAASPKKSRILTYLIVLLVTAVVGPLVFYLGFWRYEPTAQFHVPSGTQIAVRLDARELYVFEPFRRLVLPKLVTKSDDPTKPTKLDQLRSETGVDVGNDLREIIVATPDARTWVILAGGRFLGGARRGKFVAGFETAMEKAPAMGEWTPVGEVLSGPAGLGVAQADDGTIIAATSVDLAKAALPATEDFRELYLASSGAVSFSIRRGALDHLAAAQRGKIPEIAVLDQIESITGWITLGERESRLNVELATRGDAVPERVSEGVDALLGALAKPVADDPAYATLKPLFASHMLKARAGSVMLNAKLQGKESEAAMEKLAALIGAAGPSL